MKVKKKHKVIWIIIGSIAVIIFFLFCMIMIFVEDEETYDGKTVTMMVYMIGSDMESKYGAATADLQEMIDSGNDAVLNIVVQTGGAKQWQNERISADKRQRWLVQNNKISLRGELPQDSMCNPESLTDFISWSAQNFPADRYLLVLWDHGGGTMGGFGYDENFQDDSLTLSQMSSAVEQSGIKLDMMTYDACLMATLEVGYAFEPVADYLLASEETLPGNGLYYTDVLAALSKNPDMPTEELGTRFIDSFEDFYIRELNNKKDITLSLLDLREIPTLYEAYQTYFEHAEETLQMGQSGFTDLSTARSSARSYGENDSEQIDLVDYVQRTSVDGSEELIQAVQSTVKYKNDSSLTGSNGMAIYFPYISPESYDTVMRELESISYTGAEKFYNQFLSVLTSATAGNSDRNNITGWLSKDKDYSMEPWFDDTVLQNYDYQTVSNTDELVVNYSENYDAYLLDLTREQWDAMTDIQLQVILDNGSGYINLGSDQRFNWTEEGDLILDFDNNWVSIDGHLAAYEALEPVEDGDNILYTGKSSAILNGDQKIDIYLRWTQDANGNSSAEVLGYVPAEDTVATRPKGYLPLNSGDVIQLLCDFYTYDGVFDNSYYLSDPFSVTDQSAMVVDWYDLDRATVRCWLQLTDLFRQNWYTEMIEISYGD